MIPFEEIPDRLAPLTVDAEGPAVDAGGGGTTGTAPPPSEPAAGSTPAPGSSPIQDGSSDTSAPFALSDDVMYADLEEATLPEMPTDQELGVRPAQPPTVPPTAPPQATPPQAQPQQPQAPVAQQPTAQPAQPSTAEGGGPSRTPSAPELLSMVLQNRDALLTELASKRFALSPAEQEELETNAVGVIPKIMARVYFDAYTSAMHYLNQQVPGMITSHIAESRKDSEAEDAFFEAWPGIDRSKHMDDVLSFATAYRQMNPKASLADAIKFTGSAIVAKYGLQNASKAAQGAAPGRNSRGRGAAPFAPAAGGRTQITPVVDNGNPWEGMGINFDE